MHKVLITGITGFLGSHIAESFIRSNIQVIGLKRKTSDIWRCRFFEKEIDWVDIDEKGIWKKEIIQMNPDTIVHCAWVGVEAADRHDWIEQVKNIYFLADLIDVIQATTVSKLIFLGSQAEYGIVNEKVSESTPSHALTAYSGVKLACLEIVKAFSISNNINWIWLRVFSIFGEKENINWLIPSVIRKMLSDSEMAFTKAEQKYAYLYVKDFARIIMSIATRSIASGIYNISGEHAQPLREIVEQIRDRVNPGFKLKFGALPYRNDQSMHIEGDISKLTSQIGAINFSDFNEALVSTIDYCMCNKSWDESI